MPFKAEASGWQTWKPRVVFKCGHKKKNPKWRSIDGTISFKGTLENLEEQDLVLQILDYGNFRDEVLTEEQISLKGILDSQTLQIPLKFFVKEKLR